MELPSLKTTVISSLAFTTTFSMRDVNISEENSLTSSGEFF